MKMPTILLCLLLSLGVGFSGTAAAKRNAVKTVAHKTVAKKVQRVNLNTADAKTLSKAVKGFGPSRAAAIVAYRKKHGAFKSFDDLVKVKGVGKRFMQKKRAHMSEVLTLG